MTLEQVKIAIEITAIAIPITLVPLWKYWGKKRWKKYNDDRNMFRHTVLGSIGSMNEKLTVHEQEIKAIHSVLKPNGGTSIPDGINRIEKRQQYIQKAIQELRFGQQNTLDILDVASCRTDQHGKITFVSSSLCELVGCIPSEMRGNNWIGRVVAEQRERTLKAWQMSVELVTDFDEVVTFKKNDGWHQKVRVFVIHNQDDDGMLISSAGRYFAIGEAFKPKTLE